MSRGMTMLEKAARAAAVEVSKIRRTRVPAFPGSWQTHEGLGFDNLDEVSTAVARAVLIAVREPNVYVVDAGNVALSMSGLNSVEFGDSEMAFRAMIDAILNEDPTA